MNTDYSKISMQTIRQTAFITQYDLQQFKRFLGDKAVSEAFVTLMSQRSQVLFNIIDDNGSGTLDEKIIANVLGLELRETNNDCMTLTDFQKLYLTHVLADMLGDDHTLDSLVWKLMQATESKVTEYTSRVSIIALDRQLDVLYWCQYLLWPLAPIYYMLHLAVKKENFFLLSPFVLYYGDVSTNFNLVIATSFTGLTTGFLKNCLKTPRPFWVQKNARILIKHCVFDNTFATPSDHSSILTCIAVYFASVHNMPWVGIFGWILVATSRMYYGVHYPQDVVLGGAIGAVIGYVFSQHNFAQDIFNSPDLAFDYAIVYATLGFMAVVHITCFLNSIPVMVLSSWSHRSGSSKMINPESPNKTIYNVSFTVGFLLGMRLNATRQVAKIVWLFGIATNYMLVEITKCVKKTFTNHNLSYSSTNEIKTTSFSQRNGSGVMMCMEGLLYFAIGLWSSGLLTWVVEMRT
jgi:membrane-associated phospholipid phosphatase